VNNFDQTQRWVLFAVIFIGTLYVAAAFTPSHFSFALTQLGFEKTGLIAGTPQGIRSDDYFVATPMLRNVVGALSRR
jgi:hypothetical protein